MNNPFSKQTFESVWLKHFRNSQYPVSFKSIKYIKFYKDNKLPLYVNIGKNITNGMFYEIDRKESDFKGKTFLIYDVPDYFNIDLSKSSNLKVKKAVQYKGFSAQMDNHKTATDYLKYKFKAKSRYKFRRNIKKLEACFNVDYKFFCGEITKEEYEHVFKNFKALIKRRFDSLGIDNNILSKSDYYDELIYEMVLKREAVLTVIYNDGNPIGVSLSFLSDKVMFFAITSFDIDYYRFNIGQTIIIKLMDWCYENGFNVFDFSKGQYEYKNRWSNYQYNYECHILYDSKSIKSKLTAHLIHSFFRFKQYLRDKKVNYMYSKFKFLIKVKGKKKNIKSFKINNIQDSIIGLKLLNKIDLNSKEGTFLKAPLYNYLYGNPEKINKIKLYKDADKLDVFYAIGEISKLKITVDN